MVYSWENNCIEDGLLQPAFVEAVRGLHGSCLFEFSPVVPEEWEGFEQKKEAVAAKSATQARAMIGEFLSTKIKKWDIKDSKGNLVQITERSCRKLRASLQAKIFNIVVGIGATDLHPDWIKDEAFDLGEGRLLEDLKPLDEQLKN